MESVYYVREPDGALISRTAGSVTQYYHFSDLGCTLFLTNANALITDKYAYDAWGNRLSRTGTTEQPYQYVGQYGYYTHYQDTNMGGLLQLGVRFLDPSVGCFTQVDPVRDGVNWYAYVENAPLSNDDPRGVYPMRGSGSEGDAECQEIHYQCVKRSAFDRACAITKAAWPMGMIATIPGQFICGAIAKKFGWKAGLACEAGALFAAFQFIMEWKAADAHYNEEVKSCDNAYLFCRARVYDIPLRDIIVQLQ